MSDDPQGSLRDYLRVLRSSRLLIVAVTLLCAGLAAGLSLSQESEYVATARVTFQEESRSNAEAGLATVQTQTAAQLAAEGASTMLSNDVLQRVRQRLRSRATTAQLRAPLATSVDPSSTLVTVQATTGDAEFAAALANEVASATVTIQQTAERDRFARTAQSVERQYERLRAERRSGTGTEVALATLLGRIATLQTLSLNATPARVADAALVPSAPASPRPLRSTVFGGLIGLILAIGLAVARDSLDRRLREAREIQETLHMPIVGSVRVSALGNTAYVTNGRGPMTDQDVESFRILRTNIGFLDVDRTIKSILVTSALPDEGKSTVAASLAATNAAAGKRTLLLECDLRRPCFPDRLPVKRSPGLSEYLSGQAGPTDILQVVALSEAGVSPNGREGAVPSTVSVEAGKLAVIAAGGQSVRPAELLGSQRFREFLEQATAEYDTVVIDTPPLLSVSDTLEIIPFADSVLLCIRADQTTRDQALALKNVLAHLPDRTTAVVVTGFKPGRESDYGYYSDGYYAER